MTTAYLNGAIQETISMKPPDHILESLEALLEKEKKGSRKCTGKLKKCYRNSAQEIKFCRLKKLLYGLRQAGRNWHATLDKVLRKYGASPTNGDPCLHSIGKKGDLILIAVYVDDIIIASKDIEQMKILKKHLSQEFETRDLGEARYCLGIEFNREGNSITLHQKEYIIDILHQFGMAESNPVSTPMDVNQRLTKPEKRSDATMLKYPYRELVGALMYFVMSSRPDLAFIVSQLSQFNDCYDESHWTTAKRVIRYLRGSMDVGFVFEPSRSLRCYVDSDWANCPNDRRSYTDYTTILNNAAIFWEAKKQ